MFAGEDSVPGKVFIGSALLEKKTPVNATNSLLKVQPSSKKKTSVNAVHILQN